MRGSTETLGLDLSESKFLSDVEKLKGDSDSQIQDQSLLISLQCPKILVKPVNEEVSVVGTESGQDQCTARMDHAAASKLIEVQQDLDDELADLVADLITKD